MITALISTILATIAFFIWKKEEYKNNIDKWLPTNGRMKAGQQGIIREKGG